ncbi:MAG TPA: hypothetical protein PKA63_13490 [Oligoflexia bacterium]|nr:hypothetical protein [Oligoflexia bacterium]HMP49675.1 hypothetical protein [Oligoflexia bacterium]
MTLLGSLWVFVCNGGKNGEKFIERFFAIGWVMILRLFPILILILTVAFIIFDNENLETKTSWWEVLVVNFWSIFFYFRCEKHIKDVNDFHRPEA